MAVISSETIADVHLQKDGTRYVRHTFTDHTGEVHRSPLRRVAGNLTYLDYAQDRAALINLIESQLADIEMETILGKLREGLNPFRDAQNNPIDPDHISRNAAIKRVLKFIGNLDPENALQYKKAYQHLTNLTQAQVEGLGFVWTQYQNWVIKIDALRTAAIDAVKLGGE